MKPRPVHITKISGVELLPVGNSVASFHLTLTDTEGRKQTFDLTKAAVNQLSTSNINALELIALHAAKPRGLVI